MNRLYVKIICMLVIAIILLFSTGMLKSLVEERMASHDSVTKDIANAHNHINGIENFWNQAKGHMR